MSLPIVLSVDVLAGALGSVCIRGLLNLADRTALGYRRVSLALTLFFNAVFPLILMLGVLAFMGGLNAEFGQLILHPAAICNGFLTHASASAFYRGLRDLPVRTICAVSKLSDLFLPAVVFLLGRQMALNDGLFAMLSTALFIPFLRGVGWKRRPAERWVIVMIVLLPLTQTMVNHLTGADHLAKEIFAFTQLFTAMMVWRVVAVLCTNFTGIWQELKEATRERLNFVPMLLGRSVLAVVAQALFFYAVTRESGALAWPILNAGPLLSSLFAHWVLRERLRRLEGMVLVAFGAAVVFCLLLRSGGRFSF
ncbi:MAG: hypothetical protein ACOYKZ_01215 [Chlamydiia bacterium]